MTLRCPVCGDSRVRSIGSYRHTSDLFAECRRTGCDACGMVFASPMPDRGALDAYNASYFESAHGGVATSPVAIAFHSGINRLRVAYVERYLAVKNVTTDVVLEVGAGGGHFARHWIARHPLTKYLVIESDISLRPALLGLGLEVFESPDHLPEFMTVDLVVMSHVLEHTSDPSAFVQAMTARLRRGGALFVEVPCRDDEHKAQDEPHLLFFDKQPMERLLNGLNFGEIQLSYHGREIADLQETSFAARVWSAIRTRLVARGVVAPFAGVAPGLEVVEQPLERAAVAPFLAHQERRDPAWWLRAAALKY